MSDDTQAIVLTRQQVVNFYGDTIPAGQVGEGTIFVPLHPLCDALGLNWSAQSRRIRRDAVLAANTVTVLFTTSGGDQPFLALPLKLLPGFLFGLNASRVKAELRDKILRYQADCYEVLWNAFKDDVIAAAPAPRDLSPVEQALLLAEAVASMAREHLALEQRVTTIAEYTRGFIQQTRGQQTQTDHRLAAHEERLTALELRLSSGATISESQAAEIAGAVKSVAMLLTTAGDANGFGRVWGELYRRFRVTSYHNLPAASYEEALKWLSTWYDELEARQ